MAQIDEMDLIQAAMWWDETADDESKIGGADGDES